MKEILSPHFNLSFPLAERQIPAEAIQSLARIAAISLLISGLLIWLIVWMPVSVNVTVLLIAFLPAIVPVTTVVRVREIRRPDYPGCGGERMLRA